MSEDLSITVSTSRLAELVYWLERVKEATILPTEERLRVDYLIAMWKGRLGVSDE